MSNIVLHPQTKQRISHYLKSPTHALLIAGSEGIGKHFVAEHIIRTLLDLPNSMQPQEYAFLTSITPEQDKSTIGIEAIRDVQNTTKLRLPANSRGWRIILIHDAHLLTTEAQNALLKLLEEPPSQTLFILTSHQPTRLLPTIHSRVQTLPIQAPLPKELTAYFASQGSDNEAIKQAYLMSGGLPGLMSALLTNTEHPTYQAIQQARRLLQANQFERLCMVDELAKKKEEAVRLLAALQNMARTALMQSADVADGSATARIQRWHRVQRAAYEAEQAYTASAQAKLTLTNLMLSL